MTIPTISTLPTAPARTDPPATFVTRADSFLAALVTMQGELNTSIGAMNTDIATINDAIPAAQAALAAANFKGNWSDLTGALDIPASVQHSGRTWMLLEDLADVTASEPSAGNTDWSDLTVSSSPTYEAIASGTLANGDIIVINADGTVSNISQTQVILDPQETSAEFVFETGASYQYSAAYSSTENKIVIQYTDITNSSYGTCVLGSISGSTITFQTPVVFASESVFYHALAYEPNQEKMILTYSRDVVGYIARAYVGTITGDFINFVGAYNVSSNAVYNKAITYDSTSQKIIVVYRDITNSNYGTAVVGTVSGTSITFGAATVFNSASTIDIGVTYDENANKVVVAYRDSVSNIGAAQVGTVSGTSISFGSAVTFFSGTCLYPRISYDSTAQKVVVAFRDNDTPSGVAVVGTVSGTSISFGTSAIFASNGNDVSVIYDPFADKTIIAYIDLDNGSYGTSIAGTVSGTSISFGTSVVFNEGACSNMSSTYDTENNLAIIPYRDSANGSRGTAVSIKTSELASNLTSENYIGISDAAYSDTATAKVQIVGSVDDAQSGLTAGQSYYVQGDGTLATTPDEISVFAGTAVSATKLIVKG